MTDSTSSLQQWLENIWYNNGTGRFILLPLSGLYCAINSFQRWKQTRNRVKISCPVIVVGNITIGGTGKTPLTIHLVKLLQKAGYKPAIITRGYGGKATRWSQSVTATTDPELAGDEAVLMAIRTGVPVYAGADRLKSVGYIQKTHNCDVIISDDGMQHYKLPRDIQIAVVDATRMFGNGFCLPAGPLRERKNRLDDCDLVVLNENQSKQNLAEKTWFDMSLVGDVLINLKTGNKKKLQLFNNTVINAVTGIGNPQRFYKTLEQAGLCLQTHSFPDHHNFQESDIDFTDDLPIIMTEKDAAKCKNFSIDNCWYLPVTAKLDEGFNKSLLELLQKV